MDIIELICHSKNNLDNQSWFVIIAIAWSTGNAVINLTPSKEAIGDKKSIALINARGLSQLVPQRV